MRTPSSGIVIVGLGPGDPNLRTVGTQQALDQADAIILRTRVHPGIADLASDPRVSDCDDLYTSSCRFEELYPAIANRIVSRALAGGRVVYAVPGHPRFAERTVPLVEALSREHGIPVETLDAVSFVDSVLGVVNADPIERGLQLVDAVHLADTLNKEPFSAGLLGIDPVRPVLIAQVYNHSTLVAVKLALGRLYPDDHLVTLIRGAGIPGEAAVHEVPLHEFDRLQADHLSALWVPPLAPLDAARSADTLTRIVARLRAPDGCPWDREQTHESLRNAILEEAYEAVDAIDQNDNSSLAEELSDLLLLVAMHAQIGEEERAFQIEDVYESINRKLIRRHPHVFGTVEAKTPSAVISTWEGVKAKERAEKSTPSSERRIDRLPRAMPATRKAIELLAPHATLDAPDDDRCGDDLLTVIKGLIDRGIDPERALESALRRWADAMDDERRVTPGVGIVPGSEGA
jgi:tetrapyrrole methylase family protein/MazG family protein